MSPVYNVSRCIYVCEVVVSVMQHANAACLVKLTYLRMTEICNGLQNIVSQSHINLKLYITFSSKCKRANGDTRHFVHFPDMASECAAARN